MCENMINYLNIFISNLNRIVGIRCGCYAVANGMWLRYDCNDLVARVCCVCVGEISD